MRRLGAINSDRHRKQGPLSADFAEQAVELENDEVLTGLDEGARLELNQIRAALDRIETGDYGECITCGEMISVGRLEALPFAIHCIDCAEKTGTS